MPYINKELREKVDRRVRESNNLDQLGNTLNASFDEQEIEGVLNYFVSHLLSNAMFNRAAFGGKILPRYHVVNRLIGVLECIKLEFYRRVAGPYEDTAIEKNGDIEVYDWI